MRTPHLCLVVVALVVVVGSGCSNQVGGAEKTAVSGVATIGSPLQGASVTVRILGESKDIPTGGNALTGDDGTFGFELPFQQAGVPLVVCTSGGQYVEPATTTIVRPSEPWCTVATIPTQGDDLVDLRITPWTTLHAAAVGCMVERGDDVAEAQTSAAALLNAFLSADGAVAGFDFRKAIPLDVTTQPAAGIDAAAWHGLLLAGLSETARQIALTSGLEPGVRVTSDSLTAELVRDINDGGTCQFDGQGRTGGLQLGDVDLTSDTLRGAPQGLASSLLRFLEGERNASGIPADDVSDLALALAEHRSALFGPSGGFEGEGEGPGPDLDRPTVTFLQPEAGSTRGGLVRVEVTVVDASALPTVEFTAPAQTAFLAATPTCTTEATGTTCTLVGNVNTSLAPIVDGPVTISVRAVDAAGNTQSADVAFIANNSLPAISVTTPPADSTVVGIRSLSATATDADGIESLTVEIPGVGLCSAAAGAAIPDIEPNTGILLCSWDTTRSPEGPVTLTFHAVDSAGQSADLGHRVIVDNLAISTLAGGVDLGTPVVGATVTAIDWTGRQRGATIATTTTDEDGVFALALDDRARDSVLVVATGGSYVDPATGLPLTLGTDQELTAAVGSLDAGEDRQVFLNAWTTLAAARATHTPDVTDDAFALADNHTLLSRHLRRPPGAVFDVSRVQSAPLTTPITIANERAVLALAHAGLSRLAAEVSLRASTAVGGVTLMDLVTVLAEDLRTDPLLDGRGALGELLTVGPALEPVTSFTTRFDLATALDRFIVNTPLQGVAGPRNGTGITREDALGQLLYAHLADDGDIRLYPEGETPRPFDTLPPTLQARFVDAHLGRTFGEALSGTVVMSIEADDVESSITDAFATLDGVNPLQDSDNTAAVIRLAIGTEVLPNEGDVATICPLAPDAAAAAALEDAVCVCAFAEDENQNVGEGVLCFTRPSPAASISLPALGTVTVINATSSIPLAGSATSGFDLATCTATLTHATAPAPTLTAPVPSGPGCAFSQTLGAGSLADGAWTLTMSVADIAGRTGNASRGFVVDTTPPSVTITPQPVTNLRTITIGGTVGGGDLQDVTVAFLGNTTVIPLTPNATAWSSVLALDLFVGGDVPVTVTARDLNQNTRQVTQAFSFDFELPTLTLQANQPAIVDYGPAQPVAPVGILPCLFGTCIDKRRMDVTAAATRFAHDTIFRTNPGIPVVRWDSMLDSPVNAPRILVTASDNTTSPEVQVRFAIATTCSAAASRTATKLSGPNFAIDFLQANASVDLGTQTGAATLCIVIEATDGAGNVSARITRTFKWQTISTPPTVTMNPSSLVTAGRTWPGGVRDAGTFQGTSLSEWLRGSVGQYGVLHGYLHNPTSLPLQGAVNFTGGSTLALRVDVRTREQWTTGTAIPNVPQSGTGAINGGPMRSICHLGNINGDVNPSTPRPIYELAPGTCAIQPGIPSRTSGAVFDVTSWTGNTTVVTAGAARSRTNIATRPTDLLDVTATIPHPQQINLNSGVLYFTVNGADGTPLSTTNTDANGMVTIPAGGSILWLLTGANADGFPTIDFYSPNRASVDVDATPLFLATPGFNTTLPAISVTNTVFVKRTAVTPIPPKVLIWGDNIPGTNDDRNLTCAAGKCALGLRWTQADRMQALRNGTTQRMVLTTRRNSQTQSWATTTAFPTTVRTVAAPVSP